MAQAANRTMRACPRVLVVDDDEIIRRVSTRVLTDEGFEVVQATDGREALAQLERQEFDVVVTDVTMPNMTGLELLRTIRQRDLELPVILLTSALAQLWMAYQPIVRASDHSIFGYEALMRSREPSLPHPSAILDAAERLDRLFVLGQRVRTLASVPLASAPESALLFVNLHAADLEDETLVDPDSPLVRSASRVMLAPPFPRSRGATESLHRGDQDVKS
jgi:EAL domain-containing protein (putative c-di-GMP-specific phosphodiesterase class I)